MNINRICIFLPSLRGGGAERVMLLLARGFAERGHRVDLVLAKAEGSYLSQVPESIRVVDLKASRVLVALPSLLRFTKSEQPAAIVSAMGHANIIALWARRLAKVSTRLLITAHSTLSLSVQNSTVPRQRLFPMLEHYFYPWADAIVAVSKGVADDLAMVARLPRDRIKVIYNPVVTEDLFRKAEEPLEHPWFLPGCPPVILGVGRLTAAKDFPTLIRAFARVRESQLARLLILGEGDERDSLEKLVRELRLERDVSMPGFMDNPYAYMRRSSMFVLSSSWEGLPTALIEAMACGCQVISTDCPSGPEEILDGGKYGELVQVGDTKAMSSAMLRALSNTPKRVTLNWMDQFRLESVTRQYLNCISDDSIVVRNTIEQNY